MNREKELLLRMAGTIVTIVICLVAMGYSAFAYFSHSVSSGMNVIQSAHFDVVVTLVEVTEVTADEAEDVDGEASDAAMISDVSSQGEAVGSSETVLSGNRLEGCEAKIYTFKIAAAGDAQTGYCKIVIGKHGVDQQVYYTTQLYQQPAEGQISSLTIEIDMTKASGYTIEFIPQWGTSSYYVGDRVELLGENDWFGIPFEPAASTDEEMAGSDDGGATESEAASDEDVVVHIVVSGDTLSDIAKKYGVKLEDIVEYNKIANPDVISSGQILKIPLSKTEAESEPVTEATTEAAVEATTEIATEAAGEVAP